MTVVVFDPERHGPGVSLLEEITVQDEDNLNEVLVPVDVSYEVAVQTPWYYYVEE